MEASKQFATAISAMIGKPFDSKAWQQLGTSILTAEIDFNRRAGLSGKSVQLLLPSGGLAEFPRWTRLIIISTTPIPNELIPDT